MSQFPIGVYFFLDGEHYAVRSWHSVPRAGDEVLLNAPKGEQGDARGKMCFSVKRVVWGCEAEDAPNGRQDVNIEIERLTLKEPSDAT